ncbi:MAG: hypothetical protein HQL82_13475 [Magnetococcales bacterium]|nr:hypothetical protein [Magnetococcales bacterium]
MRQFQVLSVGLLALIVVIAAAACVPTEPPKPQELAIPKPIEGNTGAYLSPYTSDGVLAKWVDKAVGAETGAAIGQAAGTMVGQKAMEQIPFVGGFLGAELGKRAGREIAIQASGGMEFIKETSDLSFDKIEDLAVYMYAKHGSSEHYQNALTATMGIYPELKESYFGILQQAPRATPGQASGTQSEQTPDQKPGQAAKKKI